MVKNIRLLKWLELNLDEDMFKFQSIGFILEVDRNFPLGTYSLRESLHVLKMEKLSNSMILIIEMVSDRPNFLFLERNLEFRTRPSFFIWL